MKTIQSRSSKNWLLLTTFAVLCILITANSFADPVPQLLGRWKTEYPILGQGVQFRMNFEFSPDHTQLTVNCDFYDGTHLSSNVAARTHYLNNEIYIDENRQSVVDNGYRFCRSTLQIARWMAYFDGTGKMLLIVPGASPSQVTLVPEIKMTSLPLHD